MSDYSDILVLSQKTDELIRERDMAAAYLRITDELGPCPQLLAFINYDQSVADDDGTALESMNMFDQHNLLVSKLNVDAIDAMAMEGLGEILKKYRGVLVVAGVAAGAFGFGGIIPLAAILAGGIGFVKNARACESVGNFSKLTQAFNVAYAMDAKFASSLPSTLDKKAWDKFTEQYVFNPGDPVEESIDKIKKTLDATKPDFDKSGWTPEKYTNAVKWLQAAHDKIEKSKKDLASKVDKILAASASAKNLDAATSTNISKSVAESVHSMQTTTGIYQDVEKLLVKVGRNFEEKK